MELREAIRIRSTSKEQKSSSNNGDSTHQLAPSPDEASLDAIAIEDGSGLPGSDSFLGLADAFRQGVLAVSLSFSSESPASELDFLTAGDPVAEKADLLEAVEYYNYDLPLREGGTSGGKGTPYEGLGNAYQRTGDPRRAIAAYQAAIRLDPATTFGARYGLALSHAESSDLVRALTELREAAQHEQGGQIGPFRLMRAISVSHRPVDAVNSLRRLREQAGHDPTLAEAITHAIIQYEHLSKLGVQVPIIFRLSFRGRSLPEHCYLWRAYTASAALWSAGFATYPSLAEDMDAQNRYHAACSAAMAAAGQSVEKPPLNDQAKVHWRRQALDWLKADLTHWTKEARTGSPEGKARAIKTLRRWKSDPDLAGVRDEEPLKTLGEDEREACRALWTEVDQLLKGLTKS